MCRGLVPVSGWISSAEKAGPTHSGVTQEAGDPEPGPDSDAECVPLGRSLKSSCLCSISVNGESVPTSTNFRGMSIVSLNLVYYVNTRHLVSSLFMHINTLSVTFII